MKLGLLGMMLGAAVAAVLFVNLDDIKRYQRMRRM